MSFVRGLYLVHSAQPLREKLLLYLVHLAQPLREKLLLFYVLLLSTICLACNL
jgi:hypothetical protein